MFDWLEGYVKSLVSLPEAVSLSTKEGVKTLLVKIKVAQEDRHIFEDRHQKLLRGMTSVASLAGAKSRTRYILKIDG